MGMIFKKWFKSKSDLGYYHWEKNNQKFIIEIRYDESGLFVQMFYIVRDVEMEYDRLKEKHQTIEMTKDNYYFPIIMQRYENDFKEWESVE